MRCWELGSSFQPCHPAGVEQRTTLFVWALYLLSGRRQYSAPVADKHRKQASVDAKPRMRKEERFIISSPENRAPSSRMRTRAPIRHLPSLICPAKPK